MMRPRFAWGIVLFGTLLGVGGGIALAILLRPDRVVDAGMVPPPPGYQQAESLKLRLESDAGTFTVLGEWKRSEDDHFLAIRLDPTQPQPAIDDRFANGFASAFLRRFLAEDIQKKSRIDNVAGRRVAHVDLDLDGHATGKIRVQCAGMSIGGRILALVSIHRPALPDLEAQFDRVVEAAARLSDRAPINGSVVASYASYGAVGVTFPALMIAVFVTQRRRDAWHRARTREAAS